MNMIPVKLGIVSAVILASLATPVVVQPLSVPVSKPPLTMPLPPPLDVTVSETLVVWVAEEPVPVTVSG